MKGYQRFIFVGNLTRDVELVMAKENEISKFGVAVNGTRKNRETGKWEEYPEYFDCEHWNPGGVTEFLTKGTPVLVEGEIQTQSWEKDGESKSKKVVRVTRLQLLGGKRKEEPAMEEEFATDFR